MCTVLRALANTCKCAKLSFQMMLYISWYTLYCLSNHRRFELLQASAALVVFCLAFSGVESSITGSQINCHSLMRICSRSDLLMIALQLQPQQDSLVSSFFSGKMTGMSAAGVIWCDGKVDMPSGSVLRGMGSSFTGCRELKIKKLCTNCGATKSVFC